MAMQRDDLMPRQPGGMGSGLLLALLVHVLLVAALAVGVNWHASEPEGVEAELWAAVPQIAAPKAVEPVPVPVPAPVPVPVPVPPKRAEPAPRVEPTPDAQIAIERAKREDERKKKELAEKKAEELAEKRKQEAEAQRLAALRESNLKRMMGQAGATGEPTSSGAAAQSAGPSAGYAGRIKARIKPNIVFTDTLASNPTAEVEVRLAPDGRIVSQTLQKSSGVKEWDDAVQRAIDRTEMLPRDVDGRVPSTMVITFRPRD